MSLRGIFYSMIKLLLQRLLKSALRFVLLPFVLLTVKRQGQDKVCRVWWRPRKKTIALLVFNHGAFRSGDLETLAEKSEFTILLFNARLQGLIPQMFYSESFTSVDYYGITENSPAKESQLGARKSIKIVLRFLFRIYRIKAVLTPNVRYLNDLDWAYVSGELGVPEIVIYREGLVMYPRAVRGVVERHRLYGEFQGAQICVHNQPMKKIFVESGFAREDQVTVCGALRMTRLASLIDEVKKSSASKQILWLYFVPGLYQYDTVDDLGPRPAGTPAQLYEELLIGLLDYLLYDVRASLLIKPKTTQPKGKLPTRESLYLDLLRHKLTESKYRSLAGSRVRIDAEISMHKAIQESQVVCGLQTTALLEAAVLGKEIIIPYFRKFHDQSWSERLAYKEFPDLLPQVHDQEELHNRLKSIFDGASYCDADITKGRRKLFEEWISPLSEDVVNRHAEVIKSAVAVIDKGRVV